MAISNNTTGYRPGVCTFDTRPTAPYEGQMIYETDTNRVLIWDNAAWVMIADTDTPPGLQLVKTQTVGTGVSSVTVTDAFVDDFNVYRVLYTGGTMSTNGNILCYMGSATETAYHGSRSLISSAGTTAFTGDSNTSQWNFAGYGNASDVFVDIIFSNPKISKPTKIQAVLNDLTDKFFGSYVGVLDNTTQYTSFTLDPTGAITMTGGTVRVYGYRN